MVYYAVRMGVCVETVLSLVIVLEFNFLFSKSFCPYFILGCKFFLFQNYCIFSRILLLFCFKPALHVPLRKRKLSTLLQKKREEDYNNFCLSKNAVKFFYNIGVVDIGNKYL